MPVAEAVTGRPLTARRPSQPRDRSARGARVLQLSFPEGEPAWGAPRPPPARSRRRLSPPSPGAARRSSPPPGHREGTRSAWGGRAGGGAEGEARVPRLRTPHPRAPTGPFAPSAEGTRGPLPALGRKAPRDSEGWSS